MHTFGSTILAGLGIIQAQDIGFHHFAHTLHYIVTQRLAEAICAGHICLLSLEEEAHVGKVDILVGPVPCKSRTFLCLGTESFTSRHV